MPSLLLVMMGSMKIGIERCWKQVCGGQWYSWKSLFEKPQEALFKGNYWEFDLKPSGHLCRKPEAPLFLGCDKQWVHTTCFSRNDNILMNSRDLPFVPLPVLSGLSLSPSR